MCEIGQEREFIENLLNQRFNFLLIFFSLVIAGALSAKTQAHLALLLLVGSIICWLVSITIFRSQQKFDILFAMLPPKHPAKKIDQLAKRCFGTRRVIGYILPLFCSSLLTLGAILAYLGILRCAS